MEEKKMMMIIMNIVIGVLFVAVFLSVLVVYAQNTMGDLTYQYLCSKERRLMVEKKTRNEKLLKMHIEEEKQAKENMERFYHKWHLFMLKKPVSIFDANSLLVSINIRLMEKK